MAMFPKIEARLKRVETDLNQAINRLFPVGSEVVVRVERGWMHCVVAFEATRAEVKVRSRTGKVHHKHFHDVELAAPGGQP